MTRRDLLQLSSGLILAPSLSAQQSAPSGELRPLNRFPRMVQEWFVQQLRDAEKRRLERFNELRNKADAQEYVRSVRERIAQSFGPMPEKTPLNARVTGGYDRGAYRVENIVFESRPQFFVTASLYLPNNGGKKAPGVVGTCGHSDNGKASEFYQSFAQGLARQGYVVFLYDPIGQGERLQYVNDELKSEFGPGTREHIHGGNQQFLVGEFFGAWRAWDGIRALDYLLSRPEVDPKHVGVTGNSGGGTMTTWLCGVDRRWTMAAPSCFVTTFRRNLENELPADTEQCPPRAIALGLDHEDFIAAMAPKPVILLGKEKDYFDARGLEDAYARLKRLWGLFGAEDKIGLFIGPTYHGYSQENREAMYGWFNRATGVAEGSKEPDLTIEPDETLYCAPRGQVATLDSKPMFAFTAEKARAMSAGRAKLQGPALVGAVKDALKLAERAEAPYVRILRNLPENRGYPKPFTTHYVVETEPGAQALVYRLSEERLLSRPPRGQSRAVLYVSHQSADRELANEPLVRELLEAESGAAFYACDVRGIGESQPDTAGIDNFARPYGSDYFYAVHSLMLDKPYVGRKTHDILAVIDWLAAYGHSEIHLAAKGWGTLPAQFAALLSERVRQVTLKHAPRSYQEIAEARRYDWPLSSFVPGVLGRFDLAEIRDALSGKNLRMIEPLGALYDGKI